MKKIIFTLNIDDYAPDIREITRPPLEAWAKKIRAEIYDITERKFPDWGVTYEKLQIFKLAQEFKADWNIYIDSDALVHPDFYDVTVLLPRDTVCHNAHDFAPHRWVYDRHFLRDGRNIGSGNWFTVASDICIDLWHPIDDMTPAEAEKNIYPILAEKVYGTTANHLIDDYALSRNIARFGLKFTTIRQLRAKIGGYTQSKFLFHRYNIPHEVKIAELKRVWDGWHNTTAAMPDRPPIKVDQNGKIWI